MRKSLVAVEVGGIRRIIIIIGVVKVLLIENNILKATRARGVIIIFNGNTRCIFGINNANVLGVGICQRGNLALRAKAVFFININAVIINIPYACVK